MDKEIKKLIKMWKKMKKGLTLCGYEGYGKRYGAKE